jgi:hypothetical protein
MEPEANGRPRKKAHSTKELDGHVTVEMDPAAEVLVRDAILSCKMEVGALLSDGGAHSICIHNLISCYRLLVGIIPIQPFLQLHRYET